MSFDIMSISAYVAGLVLIFVFCKIFTRPIKWVLKAIVNGLIGGGLLLLAKFLGSFIGLTVTINPLSALIAGFLGLPGVILVLIIQNIF